MNRRLTLPAIASLTAFIATMLVMNYSGGQQPEKSTKEAPAANAITAETSTEPTKAAAPTFPAGPLNQLQAKTLLESFTSRYTKPWQDYAESPHHMLSRVAPMPIAPLRTRIEWASSSKPDNQLFATIRISKGLESTAAPCVIDRNTKEVRIFANDQWLTADEWVKTAPQPNKRHSDAP